MEALQSQLSFWENAAQKYAVGSGVDSTVQFLAQAYSPAQEAMSLLAQINSSGKGYIGDARLDVTPSDIENMQDKQMKLYDFCNDIHLELQEKVDAPFAKEFGLLAEDLFAINPKEITVTKDGFNEAMLSAMTAIVTRADVTVLDKKDKELFVRFYEIRNEDHADAMNKLFKNIPSDTAAHSFSDDVQNIKLITYIAEEPYKSVFLKYVEKISIADYDLNSTQNYRYDINRVYLDFVGNDVGINDPRGAYVTFFHECAHAIDDLSKTDILFIGKFTVWDYQNEAGQTLQSVLEEDVKTHLINSTIVAAKALGVELDDTTQNAVVGAILSPNSPACLSGRNADNIYQQVLSYYDRPTITQNNDGTLSWGKIAGTEYHTGGPGNEAVSDILGGITNNTIGYGYMHRPKDEDLDKSYTYWYATNGSSTKNQSKEFFAEYFSYSMTGSPNNQLSAVRDYFDNAGGFVDSMVEDMLE